MPSEDALREHLLSLLKGGNAHMTLDEAVRDFPVQRINENFPNGTYSAWGLLEHIRIAQWDILDFIRNPKYKEMNWPDDYWPKPGRKATAAGWDRTIALMQRDSKELQDVVRDPDTDLYARIPHGSGQTVLREALLVADHNAYHLGEFAIMRQAMGTWGKGRR